MGKRTCSIDGCGKAHKARGYCDSHYQRLMDHGDPLAGKQQYRNPEDSFAARTEWRGDCLIWTGSTNVVSGYGLITVDRKPVIAHRYAWERANGPIPDGNVIDHTCYTRACVNVAHLRLATRGQNTWNRSGPLDNSRTGVRGVYPYKGKFAVQITRDGVVHSLGTFATVGEAEEVAVRGRARLFGEFAGQSRRPRFVSPYTAARSRERLENGDPES